MPPPTSQEKLEHYARCLKIKKGSDEWYEFFDLAHASAGRIPEEIVSDERLLAKLPLVFRTLREQKLIRQQLNELAKRLKET